MNETYLPCWWFNRVMPMLLMSLTLGYIAAPLPLPGQQASTFLQRSVSVLASRETVPAPRPAALVFEGATIVDVTDGRLLPGQTVVIAGNRIHAVGAVGQVPVPVSAQVVDARGKYLIPGLWDMHVHLRNERRAIPNPRYPPLYATYPFYAAFIAHGVTGIREMGQRFAGGTDTFRVWQQEVMAGTRVGPRAAGPSADLNHRLRIRTDEDAARVMDSLKAAGMAFVKYHSDNGDPAAYFAMAREARRLGLPFVGHTPRSITAVEAADSGQSSIEHANEHRPCWPAMIRETDSVAIEQHCAPAAEAFIRNGTWLVPTMVTFSYYKFPDENVPGKADMHDIRQFVRVMRRHGVTKFLAGSDAGPNHWHQRGIWPGVSMMQELVLFSQAGLTPLEALQTATLNPAKFFNATDSLGTVAPGKLADLVLLDADPLTDIANVMKTRAVVANGRYFDRATLDTLDPEGITRLQDFAARQASATTTSTAP